MNAQFRSQIVRALRVFVVTLVASLGATQALTRSAVVAAVVAAVEVAVRSIWPAVAQGWTAGTVAKFLGWGAAKAAVKPPAA